MSVYPLMEEIRRIVFDNIEAHQTIQLLRQRQDFLVCSICIACSSDCFELVGNV